MRTNRSVTLPPVHTHEGAPARHLAPLQELRRTALSALLFEDTFYEKGGAQAERAAALIAQCRPEDVAALAVECRSRMYLRHMPLFLVRELARRKGCGSFVAAALESVIQRPDELTEYLAIYWKDGRQAVSAGSKRGLARAFRKFNAETLAKYDRAHAVKLRDVLRIVHSKPSSAEQSAEWKALIAGELPSPDTWEVALSGGADKRETFERLLRERKLGGLAFLRNLRNMIGAQVDPALMRERFAGGFGKVLPFRFVAALRYAPQFVRELDSAMQRCIADLPQLPGTTGVLVDVSGSMDAPLSAKSEMNRIDAAAGLAVLVSAVAEYPRIFTFSERLVEVPPFAGLALVKTIHDSQAHSSTYLGASVAALNQQRLDRLIVITDEQSHDAVPNPTAKGYLINVATYQHGVGYGPWVHIDGWSERVIDFVREYEVAKAEAR
jgi:hypothetical protein